MSQANNAWKNDNKNLINTLLETAKKIPPIHGYLLEEIKYLKQNIPLEASVIDFGCGNGRHLGLLEPQISQGLGVDLNRDYLEKASALYASKKIFFEEANIENYHSKKLFDIAIAMYNTFGNIENKQGLVDSMMRSLKEGGIAIISTFSPNSIPYRLEMYKMLGYHDLEIDRNSIKTEDGFLTQCFTKSEIQEIIPMAKIEPCTNIGWIIIFKKEKNANKKSKNIRIYSNSQAR